MQAISAYGDRFKDIAFTPNIDRLAKQGAVFERSYCANSICGPSRACILTGKHSHINGFIDNDSSKFNAAQPTFPKYLQQAGYQTAVIAKWHLVSNPTGFDHWEVLPGQGSYYNPDFIQMDGSTQHVRDFLDCVKSRGAPAGNEGVTRNGHIACHAAAIGWQLGRKVRFDPATEKFIGDEEANKMCRHPRRAPWTV